MLKSLAVRSDIVERMDVKLAEGEDPGPIDVANARTQSAIEGAFSARYAPAVLAALKRRAAEPPATVDAEAAAPPAAPAASAPPLPTVQPPPTFYQGLVDRMLSEQAISEDQLVQLAMQRAQAVVHELTTEGGVDAARVVLGKPLQAADANDKAVSLQLELTARP